MPTQAEVIVREGARALGHYYLDPGEYVIGRDMSCDILLDCAGISPKHAHLTITPDRLLVRDLDSTNGTFVGDSAVEGPILLPPGNLIRFGSHGTAEVRLIERMPPAANGNGHGKEGKKKTNQIADLQGALATMMAERDEVMERLAKAVADKEETAVVVEQLRSDMAGLTRRMESLARDRDELLAEQLRAVALVAELTGARGPEAETLIGRCEQLQKEKEEEARKSADQLWAISEEVLSLKQAQAQLEAEKLSLIAQTEELRAGYEAEARALQEASAIATRERDEAIAEIKGLDATASRALDLLRHERDKAVAERESAASASARIITAERDRIFSLTAERDALLRKQTQHAEKMAVEKHTIEAKLQEISGQRDKTIGEKDAMLAELTSLIEVQKRQIESFDRDQAGMVQERDAALARARELSDELTEARRQQVEMRQSAEHRCIAERQQAAGQFETVRVTLERQIADGKKSQETALHERDAARRLTEALQRERDQQSIQLADLSRIVEAQKEEMQSLLRERDMLARERNEAASRLSAEHLAAAQRLQSIEADRAKVITDKDGALAELARVIEAQKSQIQSLEQQRVSVAKERALVVKERDEALIRIEQLTEACSRHTQTAEAERAASRRNKERIAGDFDKTIADQKRQIERLSEVLGGLTTERDKARAQIVELTETHRCQKEAHEIHQQDLVAARDKALVQLQALRKDDEKKITALKEEWLKEKREWETVRDRMTEKSVAQERQIEVLTREHAKVISEKDERLADAGRHTAALQREIEERGWHRDQLAAELARHEEERGQQVAALVEERTSVLKQFGEAGQALKTQSESWGRQRDDLVQERDQLRAELAAALAAHAAQLAALVEQRDSIIREREVTQTHFAEINQAQARQIESLNEQCAAGVKEKDSAAAQLAEIFEAQKAQMESLRAERDSAVNEKEAALGELTRLNAAQQQQIEALEAERLRLDEERDETFARLEGVNTTQREQIQSLDQQRLLAIQEKTEGLAQFAQVNEVQRVRIESLNRERDNFEREMEKATARLGRIHDEHREEMELLQRGHDELLANLAALRTDCDLLRRERDEELALEAKAKENHRLQLESLVQERQELIDKRDRALVRLEAVSRSGEEDELLKARATHKAEIEAMAGQQKKIRAERDEALARLERLRESEKRQGEKLARENLDLVEERDRAVVRLEKAHEDAGKREKELAETREYLVKERDKAFALLNEAREAQKDIERAFEQITPLLGNFTDVEQSLHAAVANEPRSEENIRRMDSILAELKAKLHQARAKAGEVGRLKSFELSSAEKLLTRHKYEVSGEMATDPSFVQFRAKDLNINRFVEMKIVAAETTGRGEVSAQLVAEAQMIGRLEHPNIQPMYELSVDETGRAFYIAKLLDGATLAKILDDLHAKKASAIVNYDLRRLLAVFDHVCDALAFAHEAGVAHGHITAESVNIGSFGEVIVTGWNRARAIHQEQVGVYEEDLRPDILALGNLLYHILTLTPPGPNEAKPSKPDQGWLVPRGLWRLARRLQTNRGVASYPRVKQIQMEVAEKRYELGPRGGRASAFEKVQNYLEKWE